MYCPTLSLYKYPLPLLLSPLPWYHLFLSPERQQRRSKAVDPRNHIRMNKCAMQQNALAAREDMWVPVPDRKAPVFCPKPRRVGQLAGPDPIRPLRWLASYRVDLCDSKAGQELLDIFLIKGGEVASSPPYFCGSPPARAANPVVNDARFGKDKPVLDPVDLLGLPGPSISPRKPCAPRAKFGLKPAEVRVEGFDCLDRDRSRTQSIYAMA